MMANPQKKRLRWTDEEDNKLIVFKNKYPDQPWSFIAEQARLRRDPRSCWWRWENYLRPDLYKGPFTEEDDRTIIRLRKEKKGWTFIATQCQPQRAANDVKNYWNNHLKKRDRAIRDHDRPLLTDDGTSDHSVQEDELERRMAELHSLIHNVDPIAGIDF